MSLQLDKGKNSLEEQFVKVIGQVTREATRDVINSTANVSISKLNKDVDNITKKTVNMLNNINSAKDQCDAMVKDSTNGLQKLAKDVNSYHVGLNKILNEIKNDAMKNGNDVVNSLEALDPKIKELNMQLESICQKAVIKNTKDLTKTILQDSVVVEMEKFNVNIEKAKSSFGNLLENIDKLNVLHVDAATNLENLQKDFDSRIQKWRDTQNAVVAGLEFLADKQDKSADKIDATLHDVIQSNKNNALDNAKGFENVYAYFNSCMKSIEISEAELKKESSAIQQNIVMLRNEINASTIALKNAFINKLDFISQENSVAKESISSEITKLNKLVKILGICNIFLVIIVLYFLITR